MLDMFPDISLTGEDWLEIADFPRYYISDAGRVISTKNKKPMLMKLQKYGSRRLQILLSKKPKRIHRLVLEAFVGPCPEGMEGSHLDGNPFNNNLSNLKWESHTDNVRRKKDHGTQTQGETAPRSKLTNKQADEVRLRYKAGGVNQLKLAKEFGISQSNISELLKNKTYK